MLSSVKKTIEELSFITKDSPDAVFIKDRESKVLYLNKAAERLLGRPLHHIRGKKLSEAFSAPVFSEIEAIQKKVIDTGKMQEAEFVEQRLHFLVAFPLHDEKTRRIIGTWGVFQDTMHLKKVEKKDLDVKNRDDIKEEIEEANNRLYRLQYVTTALAKALDGREIAKIMVTLGAATLHTKLGTVWLYDAHHELYLAASSGFEKDVINKISSVRAKASTPTLDAIKKKKVILLRSLEDRKRLYPHTYSLVKSTGMQGFIAIPLVSHDRVFGVVNFSFNAQKEFSIQEQEFIQSLVEQCIQALERARLYEEEKKGKEETLGLLKRLETLQSITTQLTKALTYKDIANVIVDRAIPALDANASEIVLILDNMSRVVAYKGYPKIFDDTFVDKWQNISFQNNPLLTYDVMRSKKAMFITDTENIERKYKKAKDFYKMMNFGAEAILPLYVRGKDFGAFLLFFNKKGTFTEKEKLYMHTLAEVCSQAFERAFIYEEERKKTELVNQSEKNLQLLTKTIPHLIWTVSTDGKQEFLHDDWVKLFGKSVHGTYANRIHPNDYPLMAKNWRDAIQSGKTFSCEYRLKLKTGEYRWFLAKAVPFKDTRNNVTKWFGTATDINDQKEFNLQLEKREARFRSLIENSMDAIVLMNAKGKVLYASPSTKRVTGYTAEERIGKDVLQTIYPEDKPLVKQFIANIIATKPGEILKLRYRRINKDGSIPWMEAIGSNQLNNPEINALVVNYHNINEEVKGEEELRKAKEELEIILQNVADGVIVRSPDGKVIFANQAAIDLNREPSLADFIGTKSSSYDVSRFDRKYNLDGKELSQKDLPTYQVQHGKRGLITMVLKVVFKDTKEEQWRRIKTTGVYNAQNKLQFIVTVFHNITEEMEEQQLKDEFISIASHELKTPITSAKLYTQLLQKHATSQRDEKGYVLLGKVDRQLTRLTKLIKDLLNVSRIRSGSLGIHPEACLLQKLVEETVEEMQYTTITHKLYLQGTSQQMVSIDKERIRQVLVNLISNAIKYSPQAKRVDISIVDGEKEVSLSIKDYGIGIKKENQERIFYPFFRGVHKNAQRFPGLGLGLHIASEIVKRHNGSIKVDSTLNKGSVFTLTLPVKK